MLLLPLVLFGLVSGDGFSPPDSEDTSPCQAGHMVENDVCVPCPQGLYLDPNTRKCVSCPLNTYSTGEANTACVTCSSGQKTVNVGSSSQELCVYDVCTIPATTLSYYQTSDSITQLVAGDRVQAGAQIVITCTDNDNYVINTKYNYLKFTCIRGLDLPANCIMSASDDQEQALKCYDKCYQEKKDTHTRFLLTEGNTNKIVESCPLVSCQSSAYFDTCVSVSYKDGFTDTTRVHYSCQNADTLDDDLCVISGADLKTDDCKVTRCTEDGCNKPVAIESGSNALSCPALLISLVTSFTVLLL